LHLCCRDRLKTHDWRGVLCSRDIAEHSPIRVTRRPGPTILCVRLGERSRPVSGAPQWRWASDVALSLAPTQGVAEIAASEDDVKGVL